jgi:hypothetical protein
MASMAAFRPRAALPSSRCAAARPQALLASKVSADSPDPQAGAAPGLPSSKGGVDEQGEPTPTSGEESAAASKASAIELHRLCPNDLCRPTSAPAASAPLPLKAPPGVAPMAQSLAPRARCAAASCIARGVVVHCQQFNTACLPACLPAVRAHKRALRLRLLSSSQREASSNRADSGSSGSTGSLFNLKVVDRVEHQWLVPDTAHQGGEAGQAAGQACRAAGWRLALPHMQLNGV